MTIPKPANIHSVLNWEQVFDPNAVPVALPQLTALTECKIQEIDDEVLTCSTVSSITDLFSSSIHPHVCSGVLVYIILYITHLFSLFSLA